MIRMIPKTMVIVMASMAIRMMVKIMLIMVMPMVMGPGLGRLQTGHSQPLQKA